MTATDADLDKLYMTDEEIIRKLGVPVRDARAAIQELDRNPASGFPKKQKLWGDRRYWPAVRAYHDRINGLRLDSSPIRRAS